MYKRGITDDIRHFQGMQAMQTDTKLRPCECPEAVSQVWFQKQIIVWPLTFLFPFYHLFRYKFEIRTLFQETYCWYGQRLLSAIEWFTVDSLEFITETKEIISCTDEMLQSWLIVIYCFSLMPLTIMLRRTSKSYHKGELNIKFRSHVAMPWIDLICQDIPFLVLRVVILTKAYNNTAEPNLSGLDNLIKFFRERVSSTTIIFLIKNIISILAHFKHLWNGHFHPRQPEADHLDLESASLGN